ncbi:MAG: ubiquinol-cytochrome c reductase core subunit 1 [Thelocarpon superellum]|nr:MAG: ubiquinol-cytochrome c reductase core subunit 1 [Thelocarpon superellum]
MLARSSLCRQGQLALARCAHAGPAGPRSLATAASNPFQYETGESAGVKIAARDLPGPTTTVALVSKAGSRYQSLPGFADGLEKFAFKSTAKRSALRINREAELLGGQLSAYHTRESLVLEAKLLREDLPYFVELLGEVATQTRYTSHEFREEVLPTIRHAQKALHGSPKDLALDSAHTVAFHRGLGTPLHPDPSTPLTKYLYEDSIAAYADVAYAKPNFAVIANGASQADLAKWVGEFFADAPAQASADGLTLESAPSKYHGGETRIAHDAGNTMIIAFPGSSSFTAGASYKPEVAVLAALLGGQSSIKWSAGFSLLAQGAGGHPKVHIATEHAAYSDAGLLYMSFTGAAQDVRGASAAAVKALKKVAAGEISKDDVVKATALARFRALDAGQSIDTGVELTGSGLLQGGKPFQTDEVAKSFDRVGVEQVKKAAKSLLDGRAAVSAVGDLYVLPFAEEIGLTV